MDELPSLIEALPDSPLRDVLWKMYERLVGLERREDERLEAPQPAAEPARCAFCGEAEPPDGPLGHSCAASERALVELRAQTFAKEPALRECEHRRPFYSFATDEAVCPDCGKRAPLPAAKLPRRDDNA